MEGGKRSFGCETRVQTRVGQYENRGSDNLRRGGAEYAHAPLSRSLNSIVPESSLVVPSMPSRIIRGRKGAQVANATAKFSSVT
jgi:hypothetical protein